MALTRRQLSARRGRLAAGTVGIGLALMMILLLDGLWTGVQQRATAYEDHAGAQLAVVAAGTENLFADPSVLPAATTRGVAAVPGVTAASGVRTMYSILELHDGKAAVALVGSGPRGPGRSLGPWPPAGPPRTVRQRWTRSSPKSTASPSGTPCRCWARSCGSWA